MTTIVSSESLYEGWQDDPEFLSELAAEVFTDRICIAMEEQAVSQAELARRLGVSRQHISAFMTDPGNPTLQTIVRMAHALGLTVNIELEPAAAARSEDEAAVTEAQA